MNNRKRFKVPKWNEETDWGEELIAPLFGIALMVGTVLFMLWLGDII